MFGADFLGSDFAHRKLELLSTGYFSLTDSTVLAVRKTAGAVKGNAPFYDLCLFGKNGDLRGYEAGRYREGEPGPFSWRCASALPGRWVCSDSPVSGVSPHRAGISENTAIRWPRAGQACVISHRRPTT
ncbi:hypothetical protein FMM79_11630 [Novosphingobium sp. BW1]|nr:hypothetical protein FMM79_11630 [Novosphingobium sp. BW1]